jgi:hypothetical protein
MVASMQNIKRENSFFIFLFFISHKKQIYHRKGLRPESHGKQAHDFFLQLAGKVIKAATPKGYSI